jgi:hypothetical protein
MESTQTQKVQLKIQSPTALGAWSIMGNGNDPNKVF